MRCLQLQSSSLPLHRAKLKPQQHHIKQSTKLFWGCTHKEKVLSASSQLKAVPDCMVIANAITPPAQSGDISTLLPISALLLSLYLIANFVVPGFITKSLENQNVDDVNAIDEE